MENQNLPSLNQPKNGLIEQVRQALAEVRIGEMPAGYKTELRKLLLELFALSGLKAENFPDEYQTDLLINFIREDLGNFSIKDFKLAFRMAMKGSLEVDTNHYQAFSALYLGKIMSAYVGIRNRVRKSLQSNENTLKIDSQTTMTQEEKDQLRKDFIFESIIKPWRYYKKTGGLTFGITPIRIIYETLVEDLKVIELNLDDKKRIYNQACEKVKNYLNRSVSNMDEFRKLNALKEKIDKEGFEKTMEFEIKSECYESSVREYFLNCLQNNIDMEALVNNKL